MLARILGKKNVHTLLVGMSLEQPLQKAVWRLLKPLKTELLYDPTMPHRGMCLKECKSGYSKDTCTLMFIAEQFIIAN
jgi:hypothetical protein